ncbi:MAG: hypothetical protein ACXWTT_03325 [Methylobacter sp.]
MTTDIDFTSKRPLGGVGKLLGPTPNTQFKKVVELVAYALPFFADDVLKEGIANENGLNRKLSRYITNIGNNLGSPYFAQPESMEDKKLGNSPAPDIGIYLYQDNIAGDSPKVTVFEGKRLSSHIESKRRREYVFGHEENGKLVQSGGIERFKQSIHGRNFKYAGMIGYVQNGTFENWLEKVNTWIVEQSQRANDPQWLEEEQLESINQ